MPSISSAYPPYATSQTTLNSARLVLKSVDGEACATSGGRQRFAPHLPLGRSLGHSPV